ncbi:MAG: PAS domain-containing protein [Pseudobdellovibrionaceae bacterium]|nr:PAS domain-containing protein [Bdellovibrionales bacterium]USN47260.1 MAG: PAS domain-containing protein [Pseudobdellovibrionaceae bacterium]
MTDVHSSILVIGHPKPQSIELGADFSPSLQHAKNKVLSAKYKVIVFPLSSKSFSELVDLLHRVGQNSPETIGIGVLGDIAFDQLQQVVNQTRTLRICHSYESGELEASIHKALETHAQQQQHTELLQMASEQNNKLIELTKELEVLMVRREDKLHRSRERTEVASRKIAALQKALLAVHKARSLAEMERMLTEALKEPLGLIWTRIFLGAEGQQVEEQLSRNNAFAIAKSPLGLGGAELGRIWFARPTKNNFKKEERLFLQQIAEAVALAVDRVSKLNQAENLKQQWEATFDAISDPIAIADTDWKIIRTNRSFAEACHRPITQLAGEDAFETFFLTDEDRPQLKDQSIVQLQKTRTKGSESRTFQVNCQKIIDRQHQGDVILMMLRDITDQQRMKRQLLESAKMAELGTIGSSIAHELNNPLGGMISFLQLLKMDGENNADIVDDINNMEQAAQRCKEIVENLLGFTRQQDNSEPRWIDLRDVITQALKIVELQARSQGVDVHVSVPDHPVEVEGQFNLLSQALCNVLQNANEAVADQAEHDPRFVGQIEVRLDDAVQGHPAITVTDNGPGISSDIAPQIFNPLFTTKDSSKSSGLGLTLAYNIVREHNGHIEITSQPNGGTTAKISFKRLDLSKPSQVFDSKI